MSVGEGDECVRVGNRLVAATPEQVRAVYRQLAAPFDNVKTRQAGGGRSLSYITERQAMNRLDEVVGPENWGYHLQITHVQALNIDGVVCDLWVRIPGTGTVITREGFGGFREMQDKGKIDPENTFKTGKSDAIKLAASAHGIARYLYKDGSADFSGDEGGVTEEAPPSQPAPRRESVPAPSADIRTGQKDGQSVVNWLKRVKDETAIDMLPVAKGIAAEKGWPDRPSLWNAEQVTAAEPILKGKLRELVEARKKSGAAAPAAPANGTQPEDEDNPFEEAPAASVKPTGASTFAEYTEARLLLSEVTEKLFGVPRKTAKSGPRKGQTIEDDAAYKSNYEQAHRMLRTLLPEAHRNYRMIETAPLETINAVRAVLIDMKQALAEDERAFDELKKRVA